MGAETGDAQDDGLDNVRADGGGDSESPGDADESKPDAWVGTEPVVDAKVPEVDTAPPVDAPEPVDTALVPSGTGTRTVVASETSPGTVTRTTTDTGLFTDPLSPGTMGTGSWTRTSTGTGITGTHSTVVTHTSTGTGTGSASRSSTGTGTASGTRSTTASGTGTGTPSGTGTSTGTSTGTPSGTGTRSATSTPTGTATQTTTVVIAVTGITLNKSTDKISKGSTDRLVATVLPGNASNTAVFWSSDKATVATVSTSGLVTAVGPGTATITATTVDGGKTATCEVTVVIPVTSVNLNHTTLTVGVGESSLLTATILPIDATNQNLTWASDDEGVATLTGSGNFVNVIAVSAGTAIITATSEDGAKKGTCVVTVALSAQWARTFSGGTAASALNAVAVDASGNVYAVGTIVGTGSYGLGNNVSVVGSYSGNNAVLVKYDSTGVAQWARSLPAASGASSFSAVATNAAGYLFAVGIITGSGTYKFSDSVQATSPYAQGTSLVIVKYSQTGTVLWARTVVDAMGASTFTGVAADSLGNAYASGTISGTFFFDLGNSRTAVGPAGKNALLVKYNGTGSPIWARSAVTGNGESVFNAVAVSSGLDVYAAGHIAGGLDFGFGDNVTVKGTGTSSASLLQYDANGAPQWARTSISGGNNTDLFSVAVGSDDVYVSGSINGNTENAFGNDVMVKGAYAGGTHALLLKYNSSGAVQWGRAPVSATGLSRFSGLSLDPAGNPYLAGLLAGPGSYDFGNGIVSTTPSNGNEAVLVKFDPSGGCRAAQIATTTSSVSSFAGVAADSTSRIYAVGSITGNSAVDFGNSATVIGANPSGSNAVLVKFR